MYSYIGVALKTMRKWLTFSIFITFIIALFPAKAFAEQINRFDATIQINKNGTIYVSEKILYDFETLNKHGIYRTIPYTKTNDDGKNFRMSIDRISVVNEFGKSYHFTTSYEDDTLQLKIGDADRTITGVHTYTISYTVSGALTYFSGLTLCLHGSNGYGYWKLYQRFWSPRVPVHRLDSF